MHCMRSRSNRSRRCRSFHPCSYLLCISEVMSTCGRSNSADVGCVLRNRGQKRPEFDQVLPDLDEIMPNPASKRPSVAKVGAHIGPTSVATDRVAARFRAPTRYFIDVGPRLARRQEDTLALLSRMATGDSPSGQAARCHRGARRVCAQMYASVSMYACLCMHSCMYACFRMSVCLYVRK